MEELKSYEKFDVKYDSEQRCIKIISRMKSWREEENTELDDVTRSIEEKLLENADKPSVNCSYDDGCLVAYECDEAKLEEIRKELAQPRKTKSEGLPLNLDSVVTGENTPRPEVEELDVTTTRSIKELFRIKLNLPSYQRPYRWGRRNIEFFWNDIRDSKEVYDFGIAVFHRKGNGVYDIVDGQQRIVTLALIFRALSSNVADSFIADTTLQGKDSEKNIGYNLQWFRRQAGKLDANEKEEMRNKILEGRLDIVVMDSLEEALKFFDRINTTGVPLSETDILKSYHLLALESVTELTDDVKKRWKDSGFVAQDCLDDMKKFREAIVNRWEGIGTETLNGALGAVCALRMMKNGERPADMSSIGDISQFRDGDNPNAEYTGLDSPIKKGEFFFWYVFKICEEWGNFWKNDEYDLDSARLWYLLEERGRANEFFGLIVVYLHGKFPEEIGTGKYKKLLSLVFSWLSYFCLRLGRLEFSTIRNSAMEEGSLFNAIVSSKTLDDCFDCYCENPLEKLEREGLGEYADGSGFKYRIRRELRGIYD